MKKFMTALLSMGVACAMLLSACGAGGESSSQASSQGVSEGTASASQTQASGGGTFTLCSNQGPQTMFWPKSPSTAGRQVLLPALEPLGRVNTDGVVEPFLAEEFITDPDNLTFTIKLPEGVTFHDGSELNAEVLKWNLDQMVENGKSSEIGNPESFEVVDDYTVTIHYTEWANNWDKVIGDILVISKESYEKNGEDWCAINAVGTGPFKMTEYIQDNKISYEKFEDYRIPDCPKVDNIEVVILTDVNTQISAFMNGEISALPTGSSIAAQTLEQAGFENMAAQSPDIGNIGYILFNSKDPSQPFYDVNVRKAVLHSMDFENMAKSLTDGRGVATNQFAVPGAYSYNPNVELYTYDVELAKQMLADAGYPDGFKTNIYSNEKNRTISVAVQAALAEIGIEAEVKVVDAAVLGEMQVNESVDGIIAAAGSSQLDFTQNYIRLYSSEGIKNQKTMLFPEDYEEALFGARAAKTLDEKKELLQEASRLMTEEYALLYPVYSTFPACYVQDGVQNTGLYQASGTDWMPELVTVQ